jgi:hypothetical protein
MLALITGIGALVFVYAAGYLAHEPRRGRLLRPAGRCSCWPWSAP